MSKTKNTTKCLWLLPLVLLIFGAIGGYVLSPRQVPEGVTFIEHDFGGLTIAEVNEELEKFAEEFDKKPFEIILDEHEPLLLSRGELGVVFDVKASFEDIMGKQSLFSRLISSIARADSHVVNREIQPSIKIEEKALTEQLTSLLQEHEKTALDASLKWDGEEWVIIPEAYGEAVPNEAFDQAKAEIIENAYPISEAPIHVEYQELVPNLLAEQLAETEEFLNSFVSDPIEIAFQDEVVMLSFSSDETRELMTFNKEKVSLNPTKLKEWVSKFASTRKKGAGEVTITGTTSVESEYDHESYIKADYEGSFDSGWEIQEEDLIEKIEAIFSDSEMSRKVTPILNTIPPTILSSLEDLSFPDLLSFGRSSYEQGNSADRVKNITLSLEAFNGVIVPPGEEFSLNRTTGWITPAKGYTRTKVLYGGTVGYGIGGGVCQTSTTLYRAVVNAGLSVTERRAHTLDVSYYHKYGYGIDAAVYTVARKDFRFVNDTQHPILINTYTLPNDEAVVEIYGTSDGREVELENIPTGISNLKKWKWNVRKGEELEKRTIISRYLR